MPAYNKFAPAAEGQMLTRDQLRGMSSQGQSGPVTISDGRGGSVLMKSDGSGGWMRDIGALARPSSGRGGSGAEESGRATPGFSQALGAQPAQGPTGLGMGPSPAAYSPSAPAASASGGSWGPTIGAVLGGLGGLVTGGPIGAMAGGYAGYKAGGMFGGVPTSVQQGPAMRSGGALNTASMFGNAMRNP